MNWKDYLYIQRGDRIAIILLLILIVIAGGVYILTSPDKNQRQDIPVDKEFETFLINLKEKDTLETTPYEGRIYKDETNNYNYPRYTPQEKLKEGETIELNSSDTTELKKIPGIGSGFANRIVKYNNLLGGYSNLDQIKEVWGMDDYLYDKILPYLTIVPKTKKIRVNSATFEELNKHPYISYKQAKIIEDIRDRKGNIESMNRLSLLDEFTDNDIRRLTPYISFE
ncbi:MAG: helix-hairpin-helix domain-containing protein [Prevotella sp.]|jgi:DNA uptake protein ComE-like DNA-binding protein|nr:helix-hairpin-helix domain-containing protein [Prevotella sp.]